MDGDNDVIAYIGAEVVTNRSHPAIVFENTGRADRALTPIPLAVPHGALFDSRAVVGDFNGDLEGDVIYMLSDGLHIWNSGKNAFQTPPLQIDIPSDLLEIYRLVDYDNDGDLDILGHLLNDELNFEFVGFENLNTTGNLFQLDTAINSRFFEFFRLDVRDANFDGQLEVLMDLERISFSERGPVNHPENTTALFTEAAEDLDGNLVTYAIRGGADAAFFEIDELTAEIRFIEAPLVSNPQDFDSDNLYEVQISATDGFSTINRLILIRVVAN